MTKPTDAGGWDAGAAVEAVYRDGSAGIPAALDPAWVDDLRADFEVLFAEARAYEGGTVNRGRERFYFAVHPERLRGFADLVSHPVVTRLSERMLGPDYEFVEVAFDVPLPGAVHQPWHRDFPTPEVTASQRRLNSLAFNVTTVDVEPEMGPFEIAPGTHWDDGSAFAHGMFPPAERRGSYDALGEKRFPRRGDMSARTGLTVHRGTPNTSSVARAVLILGVVAPEVETDVHDLVLTRRYHDSLPAELRRHLRCTVVDRLTPIVQQHSIEGLVMGE
ncbi:MAG: phytanoyl-CoA dioxygenase family protein [Actinomycetota bacterium]|nr:phytanoyl-CoA dioxygenase family protein [Actinomycetota bacterium]